MSQQKFYIGVDLGATTIKSGIVDERGAILEQFKKVTESDKGPEAVIDNIQTSVQELLRRAGLRKIAGIGVGAAGIVTDDGRV